MAVVFSADGGAPRAKRTLEGKAEVVGVAGRTFTEEECVEGERGVDNEELLEGRGFEMPMADEVLEDVEDVLECVWTWCIERIEETDDEVDFRPRRPAEDRRYTEERGVRGAPGEREVRGLESRLLAGVVGKGLVALWGVLGGGWRVAEEPVWWD